MTVIISVDVSEVLDLARDLQATPGRVRPRVQRAVARNGFQVTQTAQVKAPVDTGALKGSISVDVDGLSYEAGPTVEYGGFVEEGTSGPYPIENAFGWGITVMHPGISPSPYLGPAFDQHLPAVVDEIGDAGEDLW